jgi:hypothetical protein
MGRKDPVELWIPLKGRPDNHGEGKKSTLLRSAGKEVRLFEKERKKKKKKKKKKKQKKKKKKKKKKT